VEKVAGTKMGSFERKNGANLRYPKFLHATFFLKL
jgi:hypothetical protein